MLNKISRNMVENLLMKSTMLDDFKAKMEGKMDVDGKEVIGVINRCTWKHNGMPVNVMATIAKAEGLRWCDVDVRSHPMCKAVREIGYDFLKGSFPKYVWEKTYSRKGKEDVAADVLADAFV